MEVRSNGNRIHFDVAGSGPSLLLIPGVYQAADDWKTAGYVDVLQDRFTVIAVDPLGFGGSDRPLDPSCYTFDRRVDDLVAVLDDAGAGRVMVWGYSFGGMQAEALAQREPERVQSLIMGGTLLGLGGDARRNIFESALPILRTNDWNAVFSTLHPDLPEPTRARFRARNDLAAVAASYEGSFAPLASEGTRYPGSTFNYAGSLEAWYSVAYAVAEAHDVPFAGIEGADHSRAFQDSTAVLAVVQPHLERSR